MHTLSIEYTDDVLASVGLSEEEFATKAKFLLAAQFYVDGKLSAGQAARLCDMGKVEFLHELVRHGYNASNLQEEDADAELEFARAR